MKRKRDDSKQRSYRCHSTNEEYPLIPLAYIYLRLRFIPVSRAYQNRKMYLRLRESADPFTQMQVAARAYITGGEKKTTKLIPTPTSPVGRKTHLQSLIK